MNFNRLNKVSLPVLLLVMLLNPLLGLAGTVLLETSGHLMPVTTQSVDNASMPNGESCHDHEMTTDQSLSQNQTSATSCCDDPCMCGQGGCHSPATTLSLSSFAFNTRSESSDIAPTLYTNPSLTSLNPPPIV